MSSRRPGVRVRPGVVTDADARALLGCGRAWLCRLIQRGDLRRALTGRRLPTGQAERGISRASLRKFLARREAAGGASAVVTEREACALLGCCGRTLRRLLRRGDLRRAFTGRRLPTGQAERGVSRASLKALLAARGKSSAAVEPSATVFVERVASGGSEPVRRSVARVIVDIVVEAP